MAGSSRDFEYRRLGGFTYHLLSDPSAIRRLLLKWIIAEWERDHAEAPDEPWTVDWLERLPAMRFSLAQVRLAGVRPREDLMRHEMPGYSFAAQLEQRVREREEALQRGCSMEPLLVDGANMELMDGYVRYTVLRRHRQRLVYAYVGAQDGSAGAVRHYQRRQVDGRDDDRRNAVEDGHR